MTPRSSADKSKISTLFRLPGPGLPIFTAPVKLLPMLFNVMSDPSAAVKLDAPPTTRAPELLMFTPAFTVRIPSMVIAPRVISFTSATVMSYPLVTSKVAKSLPGLFNTASPPVGVPRIRVVRPPTVIGPVWDKSSVSPPPVVIFRVPVAVEVPSRRESASCRETSEPEKTTSPLKLLAWVPRLMTLTPPLALSAAVPLAVTIPVCVMVPVEVTERLRVLVPPERTVSESSSIITVLPEALTLSKFTVSFPGTVTVPREMSPAPASRVAAPVTAMMLSEVLDIPPGALMFIVAQLKSSERVTAPNTVVISAVPLTSTLLPALCVTVPPVERVRLATTVLILPITSESKSVSMAVSRFARVMVPKLLFVLSKVRLLTPPPRFTFRIPLTTTSFPTAPSSIEPPGAGTINVASEAVRMSEACTLQPSKSVYCIIPAASTVPAASRVRRLTKS